MIDIEKTKLELQKSTSRVYLVGCGLGDVELLTLKAYKIIQNIDVVLYDNLITQEIMDIVPNDTIKICVGKKKDFHSFKQEEITELIIKYVKDGFSVARLKSGDPFVFGRGAEELQELLSNGIKTEVIAGVSSSISGCGQANIPITARGYASSFSVVSAHLKNHRLNIDWLDLLNKKNHTVVVLMGLSRIKEIVDGSLMLNINQTKPCAIVSNASRANQEVKISTLENLIVDSKDMQRPAILVFGDVVRLRASLNPNFLAL